MRQELEARLEQRGHDLEWGDIILDLDNLVTTDVEQEGKRFRLRSEVEGTCGAVFQAAGVALPPTVQQVEPSAPGGELRLVPRRLCDCATHGSVRRCYCILSKTSLRSMRVLVVIELTRLGHRCRSHHPRTVSG